MVASQTLCRSRYIGQDSRSGILRVSWYDKIYAEVAWVSPIASGSTELINPATEEVSGGVVRAGVQVTSLAVVAGWRAFPAFAK